MAELLRIPMVDSKMGPALFVSRNKLRPMIVNSFSFGHSQLSVDDLLWVDDVEDYSDGWEIVGTHCT